MKYERTIIETTVYTEFVEAESQKEAWLAPLHVRTAAVAGVQKVEP